MPVLAGLAYLALLPQARADVYQYDFTETQVTFGVPFTGLHVIFDLPSLLPDTGDVKKFSVITDGYVSPITDIQLVGVGPDACDGGSIPAPCWMVKFADGASAASSDGGGVAFDEEPGTFTGVGETLTITDVSGVPEPGSVILLLTLIAAVALVVGKRRLSRNSPALEP